MQQIGSALGKLFLLAILVGAGYYVYNLYRINAVAPPKLGAGQAAATPTPQSIATTTGASAAPAASGPRKRSAVDLAAPLELVVYEVAEGFVRTYFGRRTHVKFSPNEYVVIGNRDYAFFTVISKVTGKDPSGVSFNLPWKARVVWKDTKWHLLSLELGGQPADLSGIHPKFLFKPGKAPWLIDSGLVDEPASTEAAAKAEVEEPGPATAEEEAEPKPEEPGPETAEAPPEPPAPAPEKAESEPPQEPLKEAAKEPVQAPESKLRTWTDRSGKFKVEAEFLGTSGGKARLRKTDGNEVELPIEKLSEADQEWIRSRGQ